MSDALTDAQLDGLLPYRENIFGIKGYADVTVGQLVDQAREANRLRAELAQAIVALPALMEAAKEVEKHLSPSGSDVKALRAAIRAVENGEKSG